MPCKKKKYNSRFPPARIKKIMQSDEDVGKVAAAVPVIISRGLELFVESLLTKAAAVTVARQARTLTPFHLKQCISSEKRFDFLQEVFEKVPDINTECDNDVQTPITPLSRTPSYTSQSSVDETQKSSISQRQLAKRRHSTDLPIMKLKRPRGRPRKTAAKPAISVDAEDSDDALHMDLDRNSENEYANQNGDNNLNLNPDLFCASSSSKSILPVSGLSDIKISVGGITASVNVTIPTLNNNTNGNKSSIVPPNKQEESDDDDYD